METQKVVNLLNGSDNDSSKFATKTWYVSHNKNGTDYNESNINGTNVKFVPENIKSSFCMHIFLLRVI